MKDPQLSLLALLSDGSWHSGKHLGAVLGVSRAAIWKRLQGLQEMGLDLQTRNGKGYRINGGLELLESDKLVSAISDAHLRESITVETLFTVDSTNRFMDEALLAGCPNGSACFAEYQSKGRGRRGRVWLSPLGGNLYFSIAWRFEVGAAALGGLSLAIGLVIADTLDEYVGSAPLGVCLKWPNDLIWNMRKLGGVLLEIKGDANGECQLVAGIGLNVRMSEKRAVQIDQSVVDLEEIMRARIERNRLGGLLLCRLNQLLADYEHRGFAPYRERWLARDGFAGRQIEVLTAGRSQFGVEQGVSENGSLILNQGSELSYFQGGEVSLRETL